MDVLSEMKAKPAPKAKKKAEKEVEPAVEE